MESSSSSRRSRRIPAEQGEHVTAEGTHFDYAGNVLEEEEFYCPGCGRRYSFVKECTGWPDRPHQPIQVIPTAELSQDPSNYTPAPASENLG